MRQIKVLICEFSSVHHQNLKSGFSKAFERVGYEADIRISNDISDAVDQLERFSYEVFITDLSFNEHISVGLTFIKKIKSEYPELFVVACSSSAPTYDDTRTTQPSFDLFVPKRVVLTPSEEDLVNLGVALRDGLSRLCGFDIEIVDSSILLLKVSGHNIPERDVRALLAQIFGDLSTTSEQFQPVKVKLKPITGGYSGSLVAIAELQGEDPALQYVKTIVKFSLVDWATDEATNFKRYAKWMLPFNKRVELVGEGKTKKFGAVAYAFVFGGESDIFNLTDVIERGDDSALSKYLNIIFDDELINFYNATSLKSDTFAGQHYRKRYFPDSRITETEDKFTSTIMRDFQATRLGNGFEINGEHFPDPFRVIFSGIEKAFSLSVCHGDFNSNNIICADEDRVAYIDFQDTGPGHVLQDFAALEHSIRLNWAVRGRTMRKMKFTDLIKAERQVLGGIPPRGGGKTYQRMCIDLRKLASQRFPNLEPWEYPFAAGALALKLMRLPDLSDNQRCKLAACTLVSTQQIENLSK